MKTLTTLVFFTILSFTASAQICIGYDAAGNRISRATCLSDPNEIPNPNGLQGPEVRQAQNSIIEELEINFYPNPSTGVFNLKSNKNLIGSAIRVIDIQGRLILQEQLSSNEIDLSNNPAGLYQITVFIKNEIKQFLVEKIY